MDFLQICGIVAAVGAAVAALDKWVVKPLQKVNERLDEVERISKGQKVMGKALSQMMEHLISGNNIEELKQEYKAMRDYYIDN